MAHAGWDNTGHRTTGYMEELMARHPNLYISVRAFVGGKGQPSRPENRVIDEARKVRAIWVDLIHAFPDRVMIGGDQFFVAAETRMSFVGQRSKNNVASTVNALVQPPEGLRRKVG